MKPVATTTDLRASFASFTVKKNPQFLDVAKMAVSGKLELVGGNNMAAVHLSDALGDRTETNNES
jgi:hypothetical protein